MSLHVALTVLSWVVVVLATPWVVLRFGKKLGDWLEDQQWRL
jgi:hypothetical protein